MNFVGRNSQHSRASIETYLGVEFFPLAPRYEDIWVDDVAHHLATVNRYNGAAIVPYSVAQHSVVVSEWVERCARKGIPEPLRLNPDHAEHDAVTLAKWGLLHDASEAYIPDLASPVKRMLLHFWDPIETQLLVAVAQRFDLPWPIPDMVRHADKAVFKSERDSGVTRPVDWWQLHPDHPDAGVDIEPWPWKEAEAIFLERFRSLFGEECYASLARPGT